MPTCEVCGNEYDKTIQINCDGHTHIFDCFECAIHTLAPACEGCGCKIIGHGMESEGRFFCSAHCAGKKGVSAVKDRADAAVRD